MPATYTHHIFTNDVFNVLNDKVKDRIKDSKDIFNLFGKSFDILFFSNSKLGHKAHNYNSNLYFKNMINYIKKNNLENNSEVLAYLYGSICHYVLDSTIHPFVYYFTGVFNKNDKKTYKYRGQHAYLEYMIDAIVYKERNKEDIFRVNLSKQIFSKINFSIVLNDMIEDVFLNTFDSISGAKDINRGRKNFKILMKYGMESRFGIKKGCLKFVDFLNIFKGNRFANSNYHIKKLDFKVLNLEHKKWCYPVDKKISYHYSFYDLYDVSIEKAKKIINDLDESLNNEKDIKKVLKEIGNLSYKTGKKINIKDKMRYFNI